MEEIANMNLACFPVMRIVSNIKKPEIDLFIKSYLIYIQPQAALFLIWLIFSEITSR
jgi:hypothetical protein